MRFRRKQARDADAEALDVAETADEERTDSDEVDGGAGDEAPEVPAFDRSEGPFDDTEVDVDDGLAEGRWVDLGSLLVTPVEGADLRLQVDESSGEVLAAMLMTEDAGLELRAFAAARGDDAWGELVPELAAEAERLGGETATGVGALGRELVCMVPVTDPQGQDAMQVSRIIGVQGPRWLLRATILGLPAVKPDEAGHWEEAVRRVVVRRGSSPMAPGSPLPLTLPPDARRIDD